MATSSPITVLTIPPGVGRVLLVGGTFDPPHVAHAQMAEAARRWLDAGEERAGAKGGRGSTAIVLVPAARSPFKPPPLADDAARIEMVRAMAVEMREACVWTDEIDRARAGEPSYWVHTLERAHAALVAGWAGVAGPLADVAFLIGADQAIALHRWREARRVIELGRPVIVLRPPLGTPAALRRALGGSGFWSVPEAEYLAGRVVPATLSEVSATAIRAGLAAGAGGEEPGLSSAVARVIRDRGLYRAG